MYFPHARKCPQRYCVYGHLKHPDGNQNEGIVSPRVEVLGRGWWKASAIYYLLVRCPENEQQFPPTLLPSKPPSNVFCLCGPVSPFNYLLSIFISDKLQKENILPHSAPTCLSAHCKEAGRPRVQCPILQLRDQFTQMFKPRFF